MELRISVIQRAGKRPSLPEYQTGGAAARDLCAFLPEGDVTIAPGGALRVPTGLCMAVPQGYGGFLLARSGLAAKKGICLANGVGLIDSDYRGEVSVTLCNLGSEDFVVRDGDRIAQFLLLPAPVFELTLCESLEETERGTGGFGSTGV